MRKELVNLNQIQFKDWTDKYAEACEDMPRTHNKNSFYQIVQPRGKFEQRINSQELSALFTYLGNPI